jgi:Uri superfamily endonuclease
MHRTTGATGLPERTIAVVGDTGSLSTYVLRIGVRRQIRVGFGRFGGGRPIVVPAADYAYVGSARAERGAASMGYRLVRHATRTDGKPPHAIRAPLLGFFASDVAQPPTEKRLRWHVDYLLDNVAAEIVSVVLMGRDCASEAELAAMMNADPATYPLATGLGAGDDPGSTHLLRVCDDETWWSSLPERLAG